MNDRTENEESITVQLVYKHDPSSDGIVLTTFDVWFAAAWALAFNSPPKETPK
jgi:hypothetical protein